MWLESWLVGARVGTVTHESLTAQPAGSPDIAPHEESRGCCRVSAEWGQNLVKHAVFKAAGGTGCRDPTRELEIRVGGLPSLHLGVREWANFGEVGFLADSGHRLGEGPREGRGLCERWGADCGHIQGPEALPEG